MIIGNGLAKHVVRYGCVAAAVAALFAGGPAQAQTYPAKPVRLIVPFGVGGSVDTLSRLVAQPIGDAWGQQILVDVRPGAGSLIGTDLAAKSKPDGYTMMMANSSSTMAVSVYKTVPYDLLRDFTAAGMIGYTPHLTVVHPSVPAKNLKRSSAWRRRGRARSIIRPPAAASARIWRWKFSGRPRTST